MSIKIDKGVELPKKWSAHQKYPFPSMKVGDSFFAPVKHVNINGSIAYATAKTGFRFEARTVTEKGVKGVRVWRIS